MKELQINYNKAVPFNWDDLGWLQASIKEAIYGIISAFGIAPADSFRISGCSVSIAGSDYTTTAGWLSYNGEIMYVPAHTTTKQAGQLIYWEPDESYDPSGAKLDIDGDPVDCYKVRVAKMFSRAVDLNKMPYNAAFFSQKIADVVGMTALIAEYSQGWQVFAYSSSNFASDANNFVPDAASEVKYRLFGKFMLLDVKFLFTCAAVSFTYIDVKVPAGKQIVLGTYEFFYYGPATSSGVANQMLVTKHPSNSNWIRCTFFNPTPTVYTVGQLIGQIALDVI